MESYGRQQQVRVPPTTPSSRAHQRYPNQDTLPYPDYYRNRTPQSSNTRFSLPSPGSRPLPQSLPPQHTRRQSAAVPAQPHYVTPTRPRQQHAPDGHQGRVTQADPEQWESLRSRGYVLKGSGDQQQRASVTFAPSLAVIPVSDLLAHSAVQAGDTEPFASFRRAKFLHPPAPTQAPSQAALKDDRTYLPSKYILVCELAIIQVPMQDIIDHLTINS